jgi:hypothetical protein
MENMSSLPAKKHMKCIVAVFYACWLVVMFSLCLSLTDIITIDPGSLGMLTGLVIVFIIFTGVFISSLTGNVKPNKDHIEDNSNQTQKAQ